MDKEFELLQKPMSVDNERIDCKDTEDAEEIKMCDVDSVGSTTHSIITGGLGMLGLTILLACISLAGYIPGKIVSLLSSISGIIVFVGPIVWFVMLPDLNSGLEPSEPKWGLSHAFYLTLLSGPIIFFGGLAVLSLVGMAHIDHRRQVTMDSAWGPTALTTSVVPFLAYMQGRTKIDWKGIGLTRLAMGIALYALLLMGHEWAIGVSPMPMG